MSKKEKEITSPEDQTEIITVYYSKCPADKADKVNTKLDEFAVGCGGKFVDDGYRDEKYFRKYEFADEEQADLFYEFSNFILSRFFCGNPVDIEDLPSRLKWSFDEAIYHHIEFNDIKYAMNFYTWMRAIFVTYMTPNMFDIHIVNPVDDKSGYTVIWAFPKESQIPEDFMFESEDEDDEELFVSFNKPNKKLLN